MLNKKGFTILEIMVVMAILLVASFITSDMIVNGLKTTKFESEQATAIEYARKSMNIITKEVRGANTSEKGDYTLATAQADELAFYNDVNSDNIMEKVRYYLNDTSLIREVYLPGAQQNYSVFSASSTIAMYINNNDTPIFSYYDSGSAETAAINQVRMVEIHLVINVTPGTVPNDYVLESDVNLRNLKDY